MKTTLKHFFPYLFCLILPLASGYGNEDEVVVQPNPAEQERKAGDRMVLTINDVEYPFRWCPPGTFMMGSPINERERGLDEIQHQVVLTYGFWMLETEVTQEMWAGVMKNNNPSAIKEDKLPVDTVSWNECHEYIQKLSGLNVAPSGWRFSLPTEAQWEYACRAGTTTPFHFGDTLDRDSANFGRNLARTAEVGSYPANAWELRDMHGNVWEWCLDWYGNYPFVSVTDPVNASSGSNRVLRGGGWFHVANDCRSAFRRNRDPSVRNHAIGFRLALVRAE